MAGLSSSQKAAILAKFKNKQQSNTAKNTERNEKVIVPKEYVSFGSFAKLKQLRLQREIATNLGIMDPYFMVHEGLSKDTCQINGENYLNFSTYDYLGLNGEKSINEAANLALSKYGTSASASRVVAGEKPIHREFEQAIAKHYGTEDAVCFVSGHATNVSTISTLFDDDDIIFHDSLAHNSIVLGSKDSGAARISYAHNGIESLRKLLEEHRYKHKRCLIATEGVFSMDGNIVDLPSLIKLKEEFQCFLMVDEAHALGVIGKTGLGTFEHFGIEPTKVDIWMGTLSKTLCSCGGYIAGNKDLIELLKLSAPSFVYSVGLSPALAGASLQALKLLHEKVENVQKLQANSKFALNYAKELGLDTGKAEGTAILPIIVGNSLTAGFLSTLLYQDKICALPIIYPVVEEGAARVRLFLSASHSENEIKNALDIIAKDLVIAKQKSQEASSGDLLNNA